MSDWWPFLLRQWRFKLLWCRIFHKKWIPIQKLRGNAWFARRRRGVGRCGALEWVHSCVNYDENADTDTYVRGGSAAGEREHNRRIHLNLHALSLVVTGRWSSRCIQFSDIATPPLLHWWHIITGNHTKTHRQLYCNRVVLFMSSNSCRVQKKCSAH